jgi:hypothetical protein
MQRGQGTACLSAPPPPSPPPVPCCLLLSVMHLVMQIYTLLCSFIACFLTIQCLALVSSTFRSLFLFLDSYFQVQSQAWSDYWAAVQPLPPPAASSLPAPHSAQAQPAPSHRPLPPPPTSSKTDYAISQDRFIYAFIGSLFSSLFLSIMLISTYKYFC